MDVIESLQTGRFGVALRLPSNLEVCRDDSECAQLVDEQKSVVWFFFLFPGLHLDLREEHRADMRASLEYYARSMFDDVFNQLDHVDGERRPRTSDPTWSPLIDVEYLSVGGAEALQTVHRMAYEPGRETIMGHVLVPVRQGLFEARVVCTDQMTGLRESILVAKRMQEQPPNEENHDRVMAPFRQADFDDVRHDVAFPEHSLSRTRAALRWLCLESDVRVTEVATSDKNGELELPHLNCALVPPPRFAYEAPRVPSQEASFHRVSFCGTDGVERFNVNRWEDDARHAGTNLPRVAKSIARTLHEDSGVQDARVKVKTLASHDQRPQVLVVVEGTGHLGLLRNAMLFFQDEHQRTWSLSRCGTAAVPRKALVAELTDAARSFRFVRPPEQQKPWWKFW